MKSYFETVLNTFLIDFIFQAYKNGDDKIFWHHFDKEYQKYLKEESTYTSQLLLAECEKEYYFRSYDRDRPWGALPKEKEEIVAWTENLQSL